MRGGGATRCGIEPDAIGSLALRFHFGKRGNTFALGYVWLERK
ncbi:hypothetical protein [Rhizobium mongolense]|uniref:Uncharacterized protein n=1 Tax=Rhizobium mongolense TaxID=57676 RepID=A0ABR6IKW3_9HYPH|nr:hypothetical protein [Rhizobium mongolense]MBB4228199.1 hypothetical protein [Rhizobium mongolense]